MEDKNPSRIYSALINLKWMYISVLSFSAVINILMLSPAWYMLQVYDRVLTSYDENTLLGLSLLAVFFYIIYALLERYRGFMLVDISEKIDEEIISDLHDGILDTPKREKASKEII